MAQTSVTSVNISGIGNALSKALAAGGAETIALSRTQEDLDQLKAEVIWFCFHPALFRLSPFRLVSGDLLCSAVTQR